MKGSTNLSGRYAVIRGLTLTQSVIKTAECGCYSQEILFSLYFEYYEDSFILIDLLVSIIKYLYYSS